MGKLNVDDRAVCLLNESDLVRFSLFIYQLDETFSLEGVDRVAELADDDFTVEKIVMVRCSKL